MTAEHRPGAYQLTSLVRIRAGELHARERPANWSTSPLRRRISQPPSWSGYRRYWVDAHGRSPSARLSATRAVEGTLWHFWWEEDGKFRFVIGDREISLKDVAEAAIKLAEVAERSFQTHREPVVEAVERRAADGEW
jgi:hypothetical protein